MSRFPIRSIGLASDHGGFNYRNLIAKKLTLAGVDVVDFGTSSEKSCDYPTYAASAAEAVSNGIVDAAIILCGSGVGVSMVANKFDGIRAANCLNESMASLAREHNHANVLCIGERLVEWQTAEKIVDAFLATPWSNEDRHSRRVQMVHELTGR